MTTKYCSSCARYQSPEGGENIKNAHGRIVRWRCRACAIRATKKIDGTDRELIDKFGNSCRQSS